MNFSKISCPWTKTCILGDSPQLITRKKRKFEKGLSKLQNEQCDFHDFFDFDDFNEEYLELVSQRLSSHYKIIRSSYQYQYPFIRIGCFQKSWREALYSRFKTDLISKLSLVSYLIEQEKKHKRYKKRLFSPQKRL
jgi:hypothetical protein